MAVAVAVAVAVCAMATAKMRGGVLRLIQLLLLVHPLKELLLLVLVVRRCCRCVHATDVAEEVLEVTDPLHLCVERGPLCAHVIQCSSRQQLL